MFEILNINLQGNHAWLAYVFMVPSLAVLVIGPLAINNRFSISDGKGVQGGPGTINIVIAATAYTMMTYFGLLSVTLSLVEAGGMKMLLAALPGWALFVGAPLYVFTRMLFNPAWVLNLSNRKNLGEEDVEISQLGTTMDSNESNYRYDESA